MVHSLKFTLKMIKKRPLRMGLTLLQIAAGVASIAIVLSFVFALLNYDADTQNDVLFVETGMEIVRNNQTHQSYFPAFNQEILDAFREESAYLDSMSLLTQGYQGQIQSDGLRYMYNTILGVESSFAYLTGLEIKEGSFFTKADTESENRVMLISAQAAKELFGKESAVGKKISQSTQIENDSNLKEWEIIGVFDHDFQELGLYEPVHFIVPHTFLDEGRRNQYNQIIVKVNAEKIAEAKNELQTIFKHHFQMDAEQKNYFMGPDEEGGEVSLFFRSENYGLNTKEIARSFGLFIGSFAFISLVISSIGILSMMLVSIVERTREIGLRRSLGATRGSIVRQILSESVFISLLGGLLGIVIAFFGVEPVINQIIMKVFFNNMLGITVSLSLYPVLISLGGVALVGLLAGLYPGFQASRLAPVDAVRES